MASEFSESYLRDEASLLVKNYHRLRSQNQEMRGYVAHLSQADKLKHLSKMKQYLSFGESYLELLMNSKVALKDREAKIAKVMAHN